LERVWVGLKIRRASALGVQIPLPAPTAKAATDTGFKRIDTFGMQSAKIPGKLFCDAVVTGRGRSPDVIEGKSKSSPQHP
jgi:hypothetical protein